MANPDFLWANGLEKMSKWIKKVKLCHLNGWYFLVNSAGVELSDRQQFNKKVDAIEWANAWISSWPNIELVIEDEPQKD